MTREKDQEPGSEPCHGDVEDANPTRGEVELTLDELEGAAADRREFEREDEINDAFAPGQLFTAMGADGLPNMQVEHHAQGAPPPLTYDTLVCCEDDRAWVEEWRDELDDRDIVGRRYARLAYEVAGAGLASAAGAARERRQYVPERVLQRWGRAFVYDHDGEESTLVPVRPVRPKCKHYRRQVWGESGTSPGEPGHLDIHRNCAARRSVGGAHLSLSDQAVYCCEYRDPPDARSAQEIEEADRRKLAGRPHLKLVPAFGVAGEERDVAPEDDVWTLGGIFGRR